MRVSRLAAVILPLTLLGCGGSSTPTGPTSTPTPVVLDLVSGSYALTVTMSQSGEPVCNGGICSSLSLCSGVGGPPSVRTVTTVVRLDRSGNAVTIRPEDASSTFRLDLNVSGRAVDGTASGELRSGTAQMSVGSGQGGQTAAVAAGTMLPASVAGTIDGQVSIGGYGCSNNGHSWALSPH
jgi:hypothetical protein